MTTFVLMTILIMCGTSGVPRARMVCDDVITYGADDGSGTRNGTMEADMRGAIVFENEPGAIGCEVWKDGYQPWLGVVEIDKAHRRIVIQLKKAKA